MTQFQLIALGIAFLLSYRLGGLLLILYGLGGSGILERLIEQVRMLLHI
jgi:hypothetical protein